MSLKLSALYLLFQATPPGGDPPGPAGPNPPGSPEDPENGSDPSDDGGEYGGSIHDYELRGDRGGDRSEASLFDRVSERHREWEGENDRDARSTRSERDRDRSTGNRNHEREGSHGIESPEPTPSSESNTSPDGSHDGLGPSRLDRGTGERGASGGYRLEGTQYMDMAFFAMERGFTVTSTTGGQHNPGSVHGAGRAIDVRTRDMTAAQTDALIAEARAQGFQVRDERTRPAGQRVWSGPHIHISSPTRREQRAREHGFRLSGPRATMPLRLQENGFDSGLRDLGDNSNGR
jgi:hypothetical protein